MTAERQYDECWRSVVEAAAKLPPAPTSEEWLLAVLARNAECEFGKQHGFTAIRSIKDYQSRLPVRGYADFAAPIRRMLNGEQDILFRGAAVAFELTSGSTALNGGHGGKSSPGAKFIPYSPESLQDFRCSLLPWLAAIITRYRLSGAAYWSISPALRRPYATRGGTAIGLPDTAYLGAGLEKAFASLSSVPMWVGGIEDATLWRLLTLYYLARTPALSFIFIWSPTFFLSLLQGIKEQAGQLLALLEHGGEAEGRQLPKDAAAARRVRAYLECGDTAALWPGPLVISVWADASAAPLAAKLQAAMPQATLLPKGLLCTEGVVSVPDVDGTPLALESHGFLEFIDDTGVPRLASELEPGARYQVVMTTSGGLYRYCNGDTVLCSGKKNRHAVIHFLGRAGLCSDLAGEKLDDGFAASCLSRVQGFAMLLPSVTVRPCYRLLLDSAEHNRQSAAKAALMVEEALMKNPQYAYARKLNQLGELRELLANKASGQYLAWALPLSAGSQGVIKIPSLCANTAFNPEEAR